MNQWKARTDFGKQVASHIHVLDIRHLWHDARDTAGDLSLLDFKLQEEVVDSRLRE